METGGLEYAGRVLCLALKGFLSPMILPLPTQNPDGPEILIALVLGPGLDERLPSPSCGQ